MQLSIRDKQRFSGQAICDLDGYWYDWMLENFLNGFSAEGLIKTINRVQPANKDDVLAEVKKIEGHPLLTSMKKHDKKLMRREWLLDTIDSLARLDEKYTIKPKLISAPSFDEFVRRYYSKNKPVVIKDGMNAWPALTKWTPDYMKEHFGDATVEVQYDKDSDENYEMYSPKFKKDMLMADYVDLVVNGGVSNNCYMTGNNTKGNLNRLQELYKDVGDFAQGYRDLSVHHRSNLVWFGPAGSFTPLHFDTFNVMLAQVYGRKRITLIPASQVSNMYNDTHVYSKADFPDVDLNEFPKLNNVQKIEVILNPGEALFIPIGWWHCVEGLDVSISVSFTDFNVRNDFFVNFPGS